MTRNNMTRRNIRRNNMRRNNMRRNRAGKLLAAVLLASLTVSSLAACGTKNASKENGTGNQTEAGQDGTLTEVTTEAISGPAGAENATMPETVSESDPGVVGVSANGYAIQNIDGVTYVNGIMIVNKTYSLPQSFNPGGLNQEVLDAFAQMEAVASAQGLNIWIQSSFRSYEYQVSIYNSYVAQDGKAMADTYSARPGFSEHQSGLCFDLNSIDDSFTYTPEGQWVKEHAHEYGFVIRFPEGKEDITGYKYESWHLRYVGVDIATTMYNNNLCLEEFLGVNSVYAD